MTVQAIGSVYPWAHLVLQPAAVPACEDCGAAGDQPCDDSCPSMVEALFCELAEADAIAEANREYDAWGWAG